MNVTSHHLATAEYPIATTEGGERKLNVTVERAQVLGRYHQVSDVRGV